MYLNAEFIVSIPFALMINSNMRCIWIPLKSLTMVVYGGLIVTWDVFESSEHLFAKHSFAWLIVTWDVFEFFSPSVMEFCSKINSNMRCIWIEWKREKNSWGFGLIVTWDVFEFCSYLLNNGWTQINSNMRCIWI